MELVYLWVEKYKNIKEQGFNFSPRFDCKYDKDSNELTIDENKDYVSIFPNNINVTAIVGENGSGKSSICNSLIASQNGIIQIYRINNEFFYFDSKVNTVIYPSNFKKYGQNSTEKIKFNYDFFSQEFINDPYSYVNAEFNFSIHDVFNPMFNPSYEQINLKEYNSLIDTLIEKYSNKITILSEFNFFDKLNRQYIKLSQGEKQIYSSMLLLYDRISNSKQNDIEIIIDEIEIGLHPKWQKNIVSKITKLCHSFKDKRFHIILTSHSPFLISDIPKENIIFLEKGKQKYPFKGDKQTFGANIHTLLSDGFFMDNGLMGEFAKSKIEEIKKFYELIKFFEKRIHQKPYSYLKLIYRFKIKKFQHIQSIIGEAFLQTVIKNYLDELEIIFNGKKQFLQYEIKRLQELESTLK